MKIELDKKQYEKLIKLSFLWTFMINSFVDEDSKENVSEYNESFDYLLSIADTFGLKIWNAKDEKKALRNDEDIERFIENYLSTVQNFFKPVEK